MFTFYTYRPHGDGWFRLGNVQADDHVAAARIARKGGNWDRIKVEPEDEAARVAMGGKSKIVVNFRVTKAA